MAGIDIMEMPAASMLSVIYSMIVDEQMGPQSETTRHEARIRVDDWIEEGSAIIDRKPSPKIDPDTWGLLPDHQSGQSAALNIIGSINTGGAAGA